MPPTIDESKIREAVQRVCEAELCVVRSKDIGAVRAVAQAFDVASLFVSVPNGEEFLNNYATTVGPFIFLPLGFRYTLKGLLLIAHEVQHWRQMRENGIRMATEYLTSEPFRALYELDSDLSRWEVEYHLCGELPHFDRLTRVVKHGYAIESERHEAFAKSNALQRLAPLRTGTVQTPTALAVIDVLSSLGVTKGYFSSRDDMEAAG